MGSHAHRKDAIAALVLALGAALLLQGLTSAPASAAKTKIVSSTIALVQANSAVRRTAACPQKNKNFAFPYGGGMSVDIPPAPDGEGAYPRSYERLGQQHGFHVSPVLFDPSTAMTTARNVTVQTVCGPEPGKLASPQVSIFLTPGETKSVTATCPGGRQLIGGGFQRTTFTNKGGSFATESEAVSSNMWTATGQAFGTFGGEVGALAYCTRSKTPLLSEVVASAVIQPGTVGSATTPACTGGRRMVSTGFNTSPAASIFFAGGPFNADQSVTGSGYNRSMAPATLTVEGYCMSIKSEQKGKKGKKG